MQNENRALRLRNSIGPTIEDVITSQRSSYHETSSLTHQNHHTHYYFDEISYIKHGSLRAGEDPYIRNRFNQEESDKLSSNRGIPDTRHSM